MRSRAELRVTTGRSPRPASKVGRPTAAMHWLFMASLFRCQGAVREAVPGSRHGRVGMTSLCWGPPTPLAPSRLRAGGLPGGLPFQVPPSGCPMGSPVADWGSYGPRGPVSTRSTISPMRGRARRGPRRVRPPPPP
jgi:hypothetical protein